MFRKKNNNLIISYISLRRLIGVLGILLPLICMAGGFAFSALPAQQSISYYYHTNMRDFFVGLMMGISLFLVTYKGYERIDDILTTICGIAGFGIAFFPCRSGDGSVMHSGIFQLPPAVSDAIHVAAASLYFVLLAINSLFLFTLSKGHRKSRNKTIRNGIYIGCGIVMLLSLLCIAASFFIFNAVQRDHCRIILIFETVMLLAFGISWLVKGETLFRDPAAQKYPIDTCRQS